jgi:hypothetical protein
VLCGFMVLFIFHSVLAIAVEVSARVDVDEHQIAAVFR